jgi:hypothetical protein
MIDLPKHSRKISGPVDDAGDVNAVGGRLVENHVGANDKRTQVIAQVFASFPDLWLIRERLQSVK